MHPRGPRSRACCDPARRVVESNESCVRARCDSTADLTRELEMTHGRLKLAIAMLGIALAGAAQAKVFTDLFIFGDSNSDTGSSAHHQHDQPLPDQRDGELLHAGPVLLFRFGASVRCGPSHRRRAALRRSARDSGADADRAPGSRDRGDRRDASSSQGVTRRLRGMEGSPSRHGAFRGAAPIVSDTTAPARGSIASTRRASRIAAT